MHTPPAVCVCVCVSVNKNKMMVIAVTVSVFVWNFFGTKKPPLCLPPPCPVKHFAQEKKNQLFSFKIGCFRQHRLVSGGGGEEDAYTCMYITRGMTR